MGSHALACFTVYAIDHVIGNMNGIPGAAPISAQKELLSILPGSEKAFTQGLDGWLIRTGQSFVQAFAIVQKGKFHNVYSNLNLLGAFVHIFHPTQIIPAILIHQIASLVGSNYFCNGIIN